MEVLAQLSSGKHLSHLDRDVLRAMDKALAAADPRTIMKQHFRIDGHLLRVDDSSYRLEKFRRVFVIGAGKASGYMAEEVAEILGSRISSGLVIVPDYLRPWPTARNIKFCPGSHPIPSRQNIEAVEEMLELVESLRRDDLVVCLLSGGASALMEYPAKAVTLDDERRTTSLLLKSGANIREMNAVRKHLSCIKGGRLAQILEPSHVLTLIISDVIGDQLDAIGSGPTAPDSTTYHDAKQALAKYNLWTKIPSRVKHAIELGARGSRPETPKGGDKAFRKVRNVIVGSNRQSCQAAAAQMRRRGYHTAVLSSHLVGEAREVGRILGTIAKDINEEGRLLKPPAALISGGETTVTIKGSGKGGRNQELALSAAMAVEGCQHLVLGTLATDGVDGPTDAAGALVDGTTIARGRRLGMDPEQFLEDNDSHSYFARLGDLIKTGATGTNVNDITIIATR